MKIPNMTIKELSLYLNYEDKAEQYLIKSGILKQFDKCYMCGSSHLGRVRRGKYKCYGCNAEWNLRKGSFLELRKVQLGTFIGIAKFFADGVSASRCAEELEFGIIPVRNIYKDLRRELIGDVSFKIQDNHSVTFCISESDGQIFISPGCNFDLEIAKAELIAIRSKDSAGTYFFNFNYKTKFKKNLLHKIHQRDGPDDFYRYCQERLLNFRGRDVNSIVNVLQELAYRYNHRDTNLFEILINNLKQQD
jgi:transposase